MQPFDVKRGGRKCCLSDEPLAPGVTFYSALVETDSGLQRNDYSASAWANESLADTVGKPDGIIGWWKQQVPQVDNGKVYWAPDEILIAYFESLYSNEETETAWVMALLLLQKRLLTRIADSDEDVQKIALKCKKNGEHYELQEPDLTDEQIADIQDRLAENLFSDRPMDHEA